MRTKSAASGSKDPVKKVAAEKTTAKQTSAARKTTANKKPVESSAKRSSALMKKSGSRRYSPDASKSVEREMREMHEGKLTIGRSGKKVTDPKQAIAIGLAEARRAGEKVPPNPNE